MAKSYDINKMTDTINDDLIREALKTGLSSVKASDKLATSVIAKCQDEIEKKKPKTKLFMPWVYRLGTPLAAGVLVLVILINGNGIVYNRNKNASSMPLASGMVSGKGELEAPSAALKDTGDFAANDEVAPSTAPESAVPESGEGSFGAGPVCEEYDKEDNYTQFAMTSKDRREEQKSANEFSVFLGDRFISLDDTVTDDDVINILGEPDKKAVKILDGSSDTFEGMTVKTWEYDGLTVVIPGTKVYFISSIEISNEKYTTYRGIKVGMSVEDLKAKYENITQVLDGRTDMNNCGYVIRSNEEEYYIRFEVEDGVIKAIKYYYEFG